MKYPNAKIASNNSGESFYCLLYTLNDGLQNVCLTSAGEELNWQTSEISIPERNKLIYFSTKELAQQALDKFNNPKPMTRNYAALKQEGIDKDLCPKGYFYLGKGDDENPISNDGWDRKDIVRLHSKTDIDESGWNGSIDHGDFCVKEEIWNKKFPAQKKDITLIEIKSQLAEAKKLIGKKIKRIGGHNAGSVYRVDDVKLFLEAPPCGPLHMKFFSENGYAISLLENGINETLFCDGSFEEVKDVEVKLNSSYTATISNSGIRVGCQTFPLDIIDKLVEARKQLI